MPSPGVGQSQSGHPGVPTWARGLADYLYGPQGPLQSGTQAGQQFLGPASLFPQFAGLLNPALTGGGAQRNLAAGLTNQGIGATQNIAGQSANAAGQVGQLNSMVPGLFGAANDFAGNINQAEGGAFLPAIGAANQSLQNVMNPTMYNPLFRNYATNLATGINADFSSKGLGSSGASSAAISTGVGNLADQFAERQFQEQNQAQNTLGSLGSQFANTGVAGAQLPGQIYGQFMQGANLGQNALGQAGQNQLLPLQAAGMGAEQYWQGINNPLSVLSKIFGIGQNPLETALGGITGTTGGISVPHSEFTLGK